MEETIIRKDVTDFLEELVYTLYKKEYFGFVESAEEYVINIYDFIWKDLVSAKHWESPQTLKKYGSHYVRYKANKRTAEYVFF